MLDNILFDLAHTLIAYLYENLVEKHFFIYNMPFEVAHLMGKGASSHLVGAHFWKADYVFKSSQVTCECGSLPVPKRGEFWRPETVLHHDIL